MNQDLKHEIEKVIGGYREVKEALLFGSRALGNAKPSSDVDVALKGEIDLRLLAAISDELNETSNLPVFFDLVDYHGIKNRALKEHIDRYGQMLYRRES